jgi:two-component system response regulator ResD
VALVVDTDESVLRLLNIKLTRAGFRVVAATDGEQALADAVARRPVLVLLDTALPRLDGYQVAGELARIMGDQRPAVVFLSRASSSEAIERALRSGCDDYVLKPFSPEELMHRCRVTLLRRQIAGEMPQPPHPAETVP